MIWLEDGPVQPRLRSSDGPDALKGWDVGVSPLRVGSLSDFYGRWFTTGDIGQPQSHFRTVPLSNDGGRGLSTLTFLYDHESGLSKNGYAPTGGNHI